MAQRGAARLMVAAGVTPEMARKEAYMVEDTRLGFS
jgi:hypothetical protein